MYTDKKDNSKALTGNNGNGPPYASTRFGTNNPLILIKIGIGNNPKHKTSVTGPSLSVSFSQMCSLI